MTFNENVNLNTGIIVGGAQTWTVASGKTLTVNANINTHISPLTINCTGDAVVNGAIADVHGDTSWNGLLTGSSGSLTKSGTGTLTFSGNNTYTGDTAITAGTIRLGPTQPGLNERPARYLFRHHRPPIPPPPSSSARAWPTRPWRPTRPRKLTSIPGTSTIPAQPGYLVFRRKLQ